MVIKNNTELWEEKAALKITRLFRRFSARVYTAGINELANMLKEKSQSILTNTKKLSFATDSEMLGPLTKELKEGAKELDRLASELSDKFMIFVVGMGKYGKSTLVNALVGSKVAEVDILPKTWKIDIYEEKPGGKATVVYSEGHTKEIDYQKAISLIELEEQKRNESEKLIVTELGKMLPYLDSLKEKEEFKKALLKRHLYISDITEVKWPCEKRPFLSRYRIVDTPGLYQDTPGLESREDIRRYYHKAHGVLWLIDATKIASSSSKKIVDELEGALKKIGSETQNIIGVLNRIDLVRQDGDDAVEKVTKEAKRLFGHVFREIVPLSAKDAEKAVITKDEVLLEKSGLLKLLQEIDDVFLAEASSLKYKSALDGKRLIQDNLCQSINEYTERLVKDKKQYDSLKEETEKTLNELRQSFTAELALFLDNYTKDVTANIGKLAETLLRPELSESAKERLLRESIFRETYFVNYLNSWQYKMIEALERNSRYLIKKSVFREFENLSLQSVLLVYKEMKPEKELATGSLQRDEDFTIASVLTFAASGLLLGPIGLVLTGITGVTGLLRQIYVNFYKLPRLRSELQKSVEIITQKATDELLGSLETGLTTIAEKIEKVREDTYSFLHGPSIEAENVGKILDTIRLIISENVEPEFDLKKAIGGGEEIELARNSN